MITRQDDQDSLFGSPPPSPSLSLPSASICDNERRLSISTDTQNVGTIALPGSHPYSELPVNQLALPLNHNIVHRPPAQPQDQSVPTSSWQKIYPSQPPPPQKQPSTTKGSKKTPRSSDPEFSPCDPSAPPPVHFLRNQQNLLGKAGLVAGIKPATITHIRGATPSNPIIIDDEDTPLLGRHSQFRDPSHPYVNPGLLTAPTNEDIVSVLIGQKDIFPVLEGILNLIGKQTTRHIPTLPRQTRDDPFKHPPVKRRKLNRVPAGAIDWDVPYPFQEGEGPDEYHKTWERERAKRLIAQLVKLIKNAARKAATKNYLRKEQARQTAWEKLQQEMMPPVAATPNLDSAVTSSPGAFINPQNENTPNPVDAPSSSTTSDDQSLFNTWMTLLQAYPVAFDDQSHFQSSQAPSMDDFAFINTMGNDFHFGDNMEENSSPTPNTTAIPDDFDALISSMLNSLPQDMEYTPLSGTDQPSLVGDDAIDPSLSALSVQPVSSSSNTDTPLVGDDAIDPILSALSVQPTSDGAQGLNENLSTSHAVSPVPSMSSSGGADPKTPTSSAWEMSIPEIFLGVGGDSGQGMFRRTLWDDFSQGLYQGSTEAGDWDEIGHITRDSLSGMTETMVDRRSIMDEGKGKGKEVLRTNHMGFSSADATSHAFTQSESVFTGVQSTDIILPPFPSSTIYEQLEYPTPVPDPCPTPRPKNTLSQPRKEEILRRAREKRWQIQEELDRVKTQLWETTIEQAGLVHLLKRFENEENTAVGFGEK